MKSLRRILHRAGSWVLRRPVTGALRWRAARAVRPHGVTIVTVNFNTLSYLKVMVAAVRLHSPADTQIIVVDNASEDGTRRWARRQPGLRLIALPINVMHGPAMDIGIHTCRTDVFVALDVDAFPIRSDWLQALVAPLGDAVAVSGARYPPMESSDVAPYAHACCLAMHTSRFVDRRHTFAPGPDWDTGQSISLRESPKLALLPITSSIGPGILGSIFGGVVYHNFYAARFTTTRRDKIDWVTRGEPERAWQQAIEQHLPRDLLGETLP